ncbi:hypothetical protein [uncultured Anaerococcus sp.]|uniref:hypothetical protein n=1 Tax=uncultured Anaerococcus sp. TaxID=293428 RepID=UPI00261F5C28|nr:hypothetical protein [uncultured Anaerococcus sp.]
MDYSFFFRQLQEIINNNGIYFLPIIFIAINLLIFIISRTFRKTGLFVLALAFGLDYAIKSMPFDLYYNVPGLYNAITILYAIGFLIFFIKIAKMLIRMSKLNLDSSFKTDSKIGHFFKFTGIGPFLVMLIANLLKVENFIGQDLTRILTSITFLYMLIKTIRSTYKYLSTKESIVLGDKMDFKEIKDYLKEEDKSENKSNSKNQGRKTRKTLNTKTDDPTEVISSKDINNHRIKVQEINQANKEDFDLNDSKDLSNSSNIYSENSKLSNTGLINLVSRGFDKPRNETTMTITNLRTAEKLSYTSKRPILKIHEQNEYKIDLEFESVNEYDYGRFIDILLNYSKSKENYKFELIVKPAEDMTSSIIFYDPSNIYDINQRDYANVSGKIISMDFPKYKVNFIMGN